jgi:hypothetical protein
MIHGEFTEEELQQHALLFFKKYKDDSVYKFAHCYMNEALEYVKNEDDYRYDRKDVVSAGVLISILQNMGYLRFVDRVNNKRMHEVTNEGKEYLSSM